MSIVDLACGTGSTFRAVSPRLKTRQSWRLTDNDLSLLARTPQSSPPDIHVTTVPVDLNRDLEAALDGPADLVTTSALLDLVSDEWLERLRRAGFQHETSTSLPYTPASPRAQVSYLQRWTEGILENEESPEYGGLLAADDTPTARRLIDWCKEVLQQPDDALNSVTLQIDVSTEICSASK